MLPRNRVMDALAHKQTDRVPLDFWATAEMWGKLKQYFRTEHKSDVLERLHIDVRDFRPPYIGAPMPVFDDGSYYEPMGTHRRIVKNEYNSYDEYASFPLAYAKNAQELEQYKWCSANDYDYAGFSALIGDAHETYCTKMMVGGLFELAWALRGYEQFMMDLALTPEIPHYIMQKITDFYCEYIDRAMCAAGDKIDVIFSYDDIACQRGMLISVQMWEEFIKPYHEQMNSVAKQYGKKILYHTCGNIYQSEVLDGLIEMGIDVLNPIQMCGDMSLEQLKESYGTKLCFHGGMDIQTVLPFFEAQKIREETRKLIRIMGAEGGFVFTSTHYIQNDTPIENVIAMYEEASGTKIGPE
ncbi:MAG: uroporphyrinogen decarboxylase family protein [Christensenella sp.]